VTAWFGFMRRCPISAARPPFNAGVSYFALGDAWGAQELMAVLVAALCRDTLNKN
jgi:hypothetical protein